MSTPIKSKYIVESDSEDEGFLTSIQQKKRKEAPVDEDHKDTKPTSKKQKTNDNMGYGDDNEIFARMTNTNGNNDNNYDGGSSSDDEDTPFKPIRIEGLSPTTSNALRDQIREQLDEHYGQMLETALYQPKRYEKTPRYFQPTFISTATAPHIPNKTTGDQLSILCVNEYGHIVSRHNPKSGTTYFFSLNTEKRVIASSLHFKDCHYTMATMDNHGVLFGAKAIRDKTGKILCPAQVLYQSCFEDDRQMNYTFEMPANEDVEAIAMNRDCMFVATSNNFLRIFDFSGIELEISNIPGGVITMAAQGSFVAVYYHEERLQSGCGFKLYDTSSMMVLYETRAPFTPNSHMIWAYTSASGVNYFCDSEGWLRQFSSARGFDWKTVCQISSFRPDHQYNIWPVYVEHVAVTNNDKTEYQQKLFFFECYQRKEPLPASQLPTLKSKFIQQPLCRILALQNSKDIDDLEKKVTMQFEHQLRERLIWDEYANTNNQSMPLTLSRQTDMPWVSFGVQLAQTGSSTRAIFAGKQIRDTDILRKYIEKINTFSHLPDVDNVVRQLNQVLKERLAWKKLQIHPYAEPLPYVHQMKHNAVLKQTTNATADSVTTEHIERNNPFKSTPMKSTMSAVSVQGTPVTSNNPFRTNVSSTPSSSLFNAKK